MDNRWRSLYHMPPELWGRIREVRAGGEVPGTSGGAAGEANPPCNAKAATWTEKRVGKSMYHVPRKAAMARHMPVP